MADSEEFPDERELILKHRLDTLLEWGIPLALARQLTHAEYIPLWNIYHLKKELGATDEQIIKVLV